MIALGADLDPAAASRLVEGGYEYHAKSGAFVVREVLNGFDGGQVVAGVASTTFKCPSARSDTAFLVRDYFGTRRLRDRLEIALVMPLPPSVPPVPAASEALLATVSG